MDWLRGLFMEAPTFRGDIVVRPYNDDGRWVLIDYDHEGVIYRSLWDSGHNRRGNWISWAGDPFPQDTFQNRFFLKHLDNIALKFLNNFQRRRQYTEEHRLLWGSRDEEAPSEDGDGHGAEVVEEGEEGKVFDEDGGVWRLLTEDG